MSEPTHTWEHPTLGTFLYDYVGWSKEIELPAFSEYIYRRRGGQETRSTVKLSFTSEDLGDDRPEEPDKQAVGLADKVIANQELLNKRLLNAVWEDLNGRGPETGMWWHGDWRTIREMLVSGWKTTPPPLDSEADLNLHLGHAAIFIEPSHQDYPKPCVRFSFQSAIDPEHGIGVLSDGVRILGVGYCYCVSLYGNP